MSSEVRKIFLDTSFLNRLTQKTDLDHQNAKTYYERFLKDQGFINFGYPDLRTLPGEYFGELFDDT